MADGQSTSARCRPGKTLAVVTTLAHDKGYVLALDGHGRTIFCYTTNFETMGKYDCFDCRLGTSLCLTVIEDSKRYHQQVLYRGIEIEVVAR